MFKNYLTIAIRHLLRHKGYSLINILGLAIGMACCILIVQYVRFELSFDRYHEHADRIYHVFRGERQADGSVQYRAGVSGALGPEIAATLPDVEVTTRALLRGASVRTGDKLLDAGFSLVEPAYFHIFHLPMVDGSDPLVALNQPGTVLITQGHVERFFGDEDPVGKRVRISDSLAEGDYIIAGVLEDYPDNTSLGYGFVTIHKPSGFARTLWEDWLPGTWRNVQIFIRLREGVAPQVIESQLQRIMDHHLPELADVGEYRLQALTRKRLYGGQDFGFASGHSIDQIYALVSVAAIVVLIACVNFVNLSTAQAGRRAREVGIRKVVGSARGQLIRQFIIESILIALLAGVLAFTLAWLALPSCNDLLQLKLSIDPGLLFWGLGIVILTGLLAGAYPALFLSGFQPVAVLKGGRGPAQAVFLRRGLVVFQFALSTVLLVGAFTVYRQLTHIAQRDLGYASEGVIEVPTVLQSLRAEAETVMAEYARHPNVLSVTGVPWQSLLNPPTVTLRRTDRDTGISARTIGTDTNFIQTYGLRIREGREPIYKKNRGLGSGSNEFVLNEAAVRRLGFENSPLGMVLTLTGVDEMRLYNKKEILGTVVGVVEDFVYQSAHHPVRPLLIHQTYWLSGVHLRVRTSGLEETLAHLESTTRKFRSELVFHYRFLDDQIESAYAAERRTGVLAFTSAVLAIFVACLGLLGLAAFATERRAKEIGIRKVLGASVSSLIGLLTGEFLRLLVLANVMAWPLAYFITQRWLESFAYRVDIGVEAFALSAAAGAILTLVTVIAQTAKAAMANPVDVLGTE